MSDSTSRRVSFEQVKIMVDFMSQHQEFASGTLRTLEARHTSKSLWAELTKILNGSRLGTRKTADGWSKYWSDFKNKLKKKFHLLNKKKRNGHTSDCEAVVFTKMEKQAMTVLEPYFERRRSTRVMEASQKFDVELDVKCETSLNPFADSDMDETDPEFNDCNASIMKSPESTRSNSPDIDSMCPKWLMDVEKKRAEAELIRARAEELRADVAAKNADAALIQADAIKRLADAACLQAEAVMRIASFLESRHDRADLLTI